MNTVLTSKFKVRIDSDESPKTLSEIRDALKEGKHVYHVPDLGIHVRIFSVNWRLPQYVVGYDKNNLSWELNRA